MKIAITGKGGVGKTTLASLLAYAGRDAGKHIMAIDADPAPCLGAALGFPRALLDNLTPIAEMKSLIEKRTGAKPGTMGGFFKINPRVDDLPERFAVVHNDIQLLELGAVKLGGSGCICPQSATLRALLTHILLYQDEWVILDLYAGVEHLGRATADAVDTMLVVVEPTARSFGTARQIKQLAKDIHIDKLMLVVNRVRDESDREFARQNSPDLPIAAFLPENELVRQADRDGSVLYELDPSMRKLSQELLASLNND